MMMKTHGTMQMEAASCTGEFKTIKGKKYAFRTDGRMVSGLKFISDDGKGNFVVKADDNDEAAFGPFDTEDDFLENAPKYQVRILLLLLR